MFQKAIKVLVTTGMEGMHMPRNEAQSKESWYNHSFGRFQGVTNVHFMKNDDYGGLKWWNATKKYSHLQGFLSPVITAFHGNALEDTRHEKENAAGCNQKQCEKIRFTTSSTGMQGVQHASKVAHL
eukprot:1194395-Prorocentrum_minimum.AAC.3